MSEVKAAGPAPPVILPAAGTSAPAAAQPAAAAVPPLPHGASAVSLAGALAQLSEGDRLSGIVIGQNAAGQPLLATDHGLFALDTSLVLAQNTRLLLQILAGTDGLSALVLMMNARALSPPPTVLLTPAAGTAATAGAGPADAEAGPAAPVPTAAAAEAPAVRIDRARFTALVLDPPPADPAQEADPAAGPAPEPPAALAPGSRLGLRLVMPSGQMPPAPPSAAPNTPAPADTIPPPPAASGRDPPAAALVPGQRLVGITAGESGGKLLLRTPAGLIAIDMPAGPPPGTSLSFEILSLAGPEAATSAPDLPPPAQDPSEALRGFAQSWPALRQAVDLLRRGDPALAQTFIGRTLPQPDAELSSRLLFFLAAAEAGEIRPWIGEGMARRLEAGSGDLLQRLEGDLAQIGRIAHSPGPSGWQALALPLYDGQAIVPIMLYVRHQPRPEPDGEGEEGKSRRPAAPASRFVVELALSATGPVQIDGLVQKEALDLIIRTLRPLPETMRQDIRALFHEGLAATRTRGSLHYQVTPRFALVPLDEMAARPAGRRLVV